TGSYNKKNSCFVLASSFLLRRATGNPIIRRPRWKVRSAALGVYQKSGSPRQRAFQLRPPPRPPHPHPPLLRRLEQRAKRDLEAVRPVDERTHRQVFAPCLNVLEVAGRDPVALGKLLLG